VCVGERANGSACRAVAGCAGLVNLEIGDCKLQAAQPACPTSASPPTTSHPPPLSAASAVRARAHTHRPPHQASVSAPAGGHLTTRADRPVFQLHSCSRPVRGELGSAGTAKTPVANRCWCSMPPCRTAVATGRVRGPAGDGAPSLCCRNSVTARCAQATAKPNEGRKRGMLPGLVHG
jgi:hypothetical protein